jgi:BlaI family penicillinase repressor
MSLNPAALSRREREIMDVLYRIGQATAADVRAVMADPPSYSAVRALLRILERKGQVRHEQDGPRYIYRPSVARDKAKQSALRHLLRTFFNGSTSQVVAALIEISPRGLDGEELARVKELLVEQRRK